MKQFDHERAIQLWDETEKALHERGRAYEKNPDSMRVDPFRIFGNLYYVGDRVVCVHLLATKQGLILFDSGFPHTTDCLLDTIASAGFLPSDIKYVFHTHEHYDHFGATRRLQTRFGAKTYLHEDGAEVFRLHPHHTELQSAHSPEASLFLPDVEIKNGDRISMGEIVIECVHVPGHSAGSVSYFFDLQENGQTVHVGLCGVNGNLPLHPGRLLKYGIPLTSGDEYLASIDAMMGMDVDLALDTHPRPHGILERRLGGSDSFVDRNVWVKNLQDYRTRYHEMIGNFEKRLE